MYIFNIYIGDTYITSSLPTLAEHKVLATGQDWQHHSPSAFLPVFLFQPFFQPSTQFHSAGCSAAQVSDSQDGESPTHTSLAVPPKKENSQMTSSFSTRDI